MNTTSLLKYPSTIHDAYLRDSYISYPDESEGKKAASEGRQEGKGKEVGAHQQSCNERVILFKLTSLAMSLD
jgi:hypothetical protein